MTKTLFISLPVSDLSASTTFYKALGFSQNLQFSGEDGSAMVWMEDHGFMYTRDLADPDGHMWAALWMEPAPHGSSAIAM